MQQNSSLHQNNHSQRVVDIFQDNLSSWNLMLLHMKVYNCYYTTQGYSLLWNKPNIWREVHRYSYKKVWIYMICTMFCIWDVTACFHSDILAVLITFYKNLWKNYLSFQSHKKEKKKRYQEDIWNKIYLFQFQFLCVCTFADTSKTRLKGFSPR